MSFFARLSAAAFDLIWPAPAVARAHEMTRLDLTAPESVTIAKAFQMLDHDRGEPSQPSPATPHGGETDPAGAQPVAPAGFGSERSPEFYDGYIHGLNEAISRFTPRK